MNHGIITKENTAIVLAEAHLCGQRVSIQPITGSFRETKMVKLMQMALLNLDLVRVTSRRSDGATLVEIGLDAFGSQNITDVIHIPAQQTTTGSPSFGGKVTDTA